MALAIAKWCKSLTEGSCLDGGDYYPVRVFLMDSGWPHLFYMGLLDNKGSEHLSGMSEKKQLYCLSASPFQYWSGIIVLFQSLEQCGVRAPYSRTAFQSLWAWVRSRVHWFTSTIFKIRASVHLQHTNTQRVPVSYIYVIFNSWKWEQFETESRVSPQKRCSDFTSA